MSNNTVNTLKLLKVIDDYREISSDYRSKFKVIDEKSRLTLRLNSALGCVIRNSAENNKISVNEYIIQAIFEKLAVDNYLKKLEAEIDDFTLLTAKKDSMPSNETLLDIDKFHQSRSKYMEKINATNATKYRIMHHY